MAHSGLTSDYCLSFELMVRIQGHGDRNSPVTVGHRPRASQKDTSLAIGLGPLARE